MATRHILLANLAVANEIILMKINNSVSKSSKYLTL